MLHDLIDVINIQSKDGNQKLSEEHHFQNMKQSIGDFMLIFPFSQQSLDCSIKGLKNGNSNMKTIIQELKKKKKNINH